MMLVPAVRRLLLALSSVSVLAVGSSGLLAAPAEEYDPSPAGTRWLEAANGLAIKVLVEAANLGGAEVEIAEITFPADSQGAAHVHGSVEIFYVLSGKMDHVVNGVSHPLDPGMVGVVRSGDRVAHGVLSEEPVKALVIWAPGGEAERLSQFFDSRPVEE